MYIFFWYKFSGCDVYFVFLNYFYFMEKIMGSYRDIVSCVNLCVEKFYKIFCFSYCCIYGLLYFKLYDLFIDIFFFFNNVWFKCV